MRTASSARRVRTAGHIAPARVGRPSRPIFGNSRSSRMRGLPTKGLPPTIHALLPIILIRNKILCRVFTLPRPGRRMCRL
eukprot:13960585-Heterocapsa_arctica.AAC.1